MVRPTPGYIATPPALGLPPSPVRIATPQLWATPKRHDLAPMLEELRGFLKRRAGWFDTAGQNGEFSVAAVIGIARYRQMLTRATTTYDQIQTSIHSPVARSEGWQDPEAFNALDQEFQFNAMFVPIIDQLITTAQNQRTLAAGDNVLRYATPLVQVTVEDFFTGIAAASSENPLVKAAAPDRLGRVAEHIQLLARYDQVTARYQEALTRLKQLTSPLVGVDVPWAGYYEPEHPSLKGRNPSTVPDVFLNNHPLQKAFHAVMGGPLEEGYRQVFKVLNRDPASPDHQKAELMADAAWDEGEKKFASWNGTPWTRLEEVTTQRELVVERMEELAKAAEPFKTSSDTPIEKAIPEMKVGIQQAKALIREAEAILDRWYMPTIPEDIQRLKPFAVQLNTAETAIDDAAVALSAGDSARAISQYTVAQRAYIMALETPRFKTLIADVEEYQKLSLYPKLAGMVVSIWFGAALGGMAAVGARGALSRWLLGPGLAIASRTVMGVNVGRIAIGGASLVANATIFSVTTSWLNHLAFSDVPLPKGVHGWGYEFVSNTVMFGILGGMAVVVAKRVKTITQGLEKTVLRTAVTPLRGEGFVIKSMHTIAPPNWLLKQIPGATGEVLELIPTYLFFAGIWTPLDMIAQDSVTNGTLPTWEKVKAAYNESYTLQSLGMQLGVLAALSVGKQGGLTRILAEKMYARVNKMVTSRLETLGERRATLQQKLDALRTEGSGNTIERMARETALRRDIAETLREEHTIVSIVMENTPDVNDYKAKLLSAHQKHDTAAHQLQSMATLLRVTQEARLESVGSGIMTYVPSAQDAIRRLCAHQTDVFSMRDVGNGNFILSMNKGVGGVYEVTLVPKPTGPLSTATDIVPQ